MTFWDLFLFESNDNFMGRFSGGNLQWGFHYFYVLWVV
jgi:hypothetical protein